MFRKTLSLILTLAMLLGIVLIPCNAKKSSEETHITEDATRVSSQMEIDGSIVRCTYEKNTSEYNLYLDDVKYDLNVDMYDGCAMVYLAGEEQTDYNKQVVGQSAAAIALSAGYWAPAIVAAAKIVIASVVAATLAVVTYYSAELIATTINGVKTRSITKSDLRAKTKTATRALELVKTAKKDNKRYYYAAYLYKDMVMLGNQISYSAAVNRLKKGYDVFASDYNGARLAAMSASPKYQAKFENAHNGSGDRFPHFHPIGVKWVKNPTKRPHCWFT